MVLTQSFTIFVLLGCCILGGFISTKKYWKYLFVITVILSFVAFHYEPFLRTDLWWHYFHWEELKSVGYSFSNEQYDMLPLWKNYLWVIALIGEKRLIPAVSLFISYGVVFYILWQEAKINQKYNGMWIGVIFILLNINYIGWISNVRNNMAFALFLLAAYFEYRKKINKVLCWIVMVILCFLHPAIVLLVGLRMLLNLFSKKSLGFMTIILVLFPVILQAFTSGVSVVFNGTFVGYVFNKVINYIFEAEEYHAKDMVFLVIRFITSTYILYSHLGRKNTREWDMWDKLVYAIWAMTLGLFNKYIVFYRMNEVLSMAAIKYVVMDGRLEGFLGENKGEINKYGFLILMESVLMFAYHNLLGTYYISKFVF